MHNLRTPSLVVFDLDGTLYDFEKSNLFATTALINSFASFTKVDIEDVAKSLAQSRLSVKRRLGATASSHSRLLYISEAFRILKIRPDPQLFIILEEIFWENYLSKMELYKGVKSLLDEIHFNGIQTALVTDLTSNIQFRKISQLGLNRFFDVIVTSEEAGKDKPSGLPFDLLEEYLMQIPPNSWFFGDSEFDCPEKIIHEAIFFRMGMGVDFHRTKNRFFFSNYLELRSHINFY